MSASIGQKIEEEYSRIRQNNEMIRKRRVEEIYAKIPRIADADKKLYELRDKMIRAFSDRKIDVDSVKAEVDRVLDARGALLRQNGFPEDYTTAVYTCPNCCDTGFIMATPCECYKTKRIKYLFEYSNLSEVMKEQTFDKFRLDFYSNEPYGEFMSPLKNAGIILSKCKGFAEKDEYKQGKNLYLFGDSGLGKTFLCSCMANALIAKGVSVLYQTAYNIITEMEEQKFRYAENTEKTSLYYNVPVLIIDDLGTEFPSSFTSAVMFDIINNRLIRNLSTVISTNLRIDEIEKPYGVRVQSRIVGEYELLKLYGEDIRAKKILG